MGRIYSMLLVVMAIWGFNLSALAILVQNIDPITLTSIRIFVAGIAVLIMTGVLGIFRLPTKKEWKTIVIIMFFNVVLHHSFLALGLTKTSGVNAGIILGAAPLVTMVLSIVFLKDRMTRLRVFGFMLGFLGIIVTTLANGDGLAGISFGDGFILLSMLAQAISFILIGKLNPTFDPRLLTGYMLIVGSCFILISASVIEGDLAQMTLLFEPKLLAIFLFSAIVATAFGHMTYNYAITHVGPAETTIFVNLNTLFAILGTAIFLGETIVGQHYLGLSLIIIGVIFGTGTIDYLLEKRRTS